MSSLNILQEMRERELIKQGFHTPEPVDEEMIKHIDRILEHDRNYDRKYYHARKRLKKAGLSNVQCPNCFTRVEIVKNFSETNKLYNCNNCGASFSGYEVFGTMAQS